MCQFHQGPGINELLANHCSLLATSLQQLSFVCTLLRFLVLKDHEIKTLFVCTLLKFQYWLLVLWALKDWNHALTTVVTVRDVTAIPHYMVPYPLLVNKGVDSLAKCEVIQASFILLIFSFALTFIYGILHLL